MLKKIKIAMERTVTIHSQLTVTIHHPSVVFTFMMRSVSTAMVSAMLASGVDVILNKFDFDVNFKIVDLTE